MCHLINACIKSSEVKNSEVKSNYNDDSSPEMCVATAAVEVSIYILLTAAHSVESPLWHWTSSNSPRSQPFPPIQSELLVLSFSKGISALWDIMEN